MIECNGIGVVSSQILLFGFANKEGVELNMMESISSYSIQSFNFHPSNLGCMQLNQLVRYVPLRLINKIPKLWNEIFDPFHFVALHFIRFHSAPLCSSSSI